MTKRDQKRGYGGAVFVSAGASFDAAGAVFRGNIATRGGGACVLNLEPGCVVGFSDELKIYSYGVAFPPGAIFEVEAAIDVDLVHFSSDVAEVSHVACLIRTCALFVCDICSLAHARSLVLVER